MRVVEIRERFGLEHVVLGARPEPKPGPGQILLRMRAAALNYRDLLMARGEYDARQPLPLVPGSDGVGEITACGPGVERVRVGDRVCPIFAQRWIGGRPTREKLRSTLGGPLDGTFAEAMLLDADGVVPAPDHLTNEEAATLPCAGVTAWNALLTHGGLRPGQTVLVQGTGGVSLFALQLATLFGARVIVTSRSAAKLEQAKKLGAWQTIDTGRTPEWGRAARALTGEDGVDLVVDVGGAATFEQASAATGFGGRIALVGNLGGAKATINLVPLFMRQIRVQGVLVGSREDLEALSRAVSAHRLRPAVSRVFALEEARAALEHLGRGEHVGKIALRIA